MPEILRLLLADDHELFREGLVGLLSRQPDMQVVGQAENGEEALIRTREYMPDVVLMDIDMPIMDGLQATKAISTEMPYVKIVMLTVHEDEDKLFEAIKNGAHGYLLKNIRATEMVTVLRGIALGEAPISRMMATRLLQEFVQRSQAAPKSSTKNSDSRLEQLTLREREVLELVAQRLSNKEIAVRLSLSEYTVKNHLRNILAKLHLSNRSQAAQTLLRAKHGY